MLEIVHNRLTLDQSPPPSLKRYSGRFSEAALVGMRRAMAKKGKSRGSIEERAIVQRFLGP